MVVFRKIIQWSAILLIFIIAGSLGYVWIEGWDFFDSLWMTVITLTTVGYEEVRPLSPVGRAYSMVLMLSGIGVLFYIITGLARDGGGRGDPSSPGEAQVAEAHSKSSKSTTSSVGSAASAKSSPGSSKSGVYPL